MGNEISNNKDVLDSRDVIERIKELERELGDIYDSSTAQPTVIFDAWLSETAENPDATMQDAAEELLVLRNLQEQCEEYGNDWQYGATLVRDSYFESYAEELAEDIGVIDRNASWPLTCIDWEQAARELKQDYTSVEFDGVTYWVR